MKKFLLAVAAFGMLMTSCTNDETTQGDNSSSVKFTVSTPEMKTRADIIDVYGTGFAAEDLEYAIYECDAEGNIKNNTPNISKEIEGAFAGNALETTFTERLVNGKHYVILFWADATNDPYTVDWEAQTVSITDPTALMAQDENLDAFFSKVQFTVKNNMLEQTVELKRPFAQLNVGVSDTAAAATAGLKVAQTQAKVKAYTSLNLFDGSVSGQQELTYQFANIPENVTFTDPEGTAYDIISMNYLLVNEKELNDVIFTYTDADDAQAIPERTFSLVPVQRNHRTFIVGDLLTTAVNVKVIIIPGFDGDIIYPTSIALALTEGGLFKLQGDTTLDKSYTLSAATTIDLNGYTLTCAGSDDIMIRVADGGSLTFTGEGTVDAGNNYVASANEGGVITVESGNFTTTGTTLFQANGGEVYITGGYFTVDNEEYGTTYMLNHIDSKKNDGLIEVTGGQFVDYNPAASKSENPVMSFVPDGYASSVTGTTADGESIYKVSKAVPMTNLTAAPAQLYQAANLSWDAVDGAAKYVVKYNGVQVGETTTTAVTTAEGGVTDAAVAKFTVEALDENGGMVGVGETPETKVFTLINRPEPEVRLANGRLEMATDFEWSDGYGGDWTEFGNLHENGIILAAEVYFYKDGEAMPAYTAKATSADQTGALKTYKTAFDYKYVKGSNMFMAFTQWAWAEGTGSFGGITANAPEFKPGTYTIKYNAKYIAILDGKYNNKANDGTSNPDRMHFSAALVDAVDNDINATLQKAISREGEVEAKFAVASVTPTVAPEGYQGAKVTWAAIQGATSYKVFVDGAEKANVQATEAVITGLNTKNNYSFAVKAYDQNGAVVASGDAVEAQVFSLVNTPAPVVTFVDGKLNATNLVDVTGVAMNMTVYFTKEGESAPAYTAYSEHYFNSTSDIDININTDQKFKFADFDTFTKWTWDGSTDKTKATDAAQALEPATYNITYVANYYPVVGGIWRDKDKKEVASKELAGANGRITYPSAASVLRVDTPYEGTANDVIIGFVVKASINEGTTRPSTEGGHRGNFAVNGLYQAVKLSWNNISSIDKVVIEYDGTSKEITPADWTVANGSAEYVLTGLTKTHYDFVVKAYANGTEFSTQTVSSDVYTIEGVQNNIRFEAIDQKNGTWMFNTYGIGGENYSFVRIEMDIYKKGETTPMFVTVWKDLEGTQQTWAKNRGASSYNEITNSDYDDSIKDPNITTGNSEYFKGFEAGTTYEVKVRYTGYAHIYDAAADAADYHKHPEWFYYSSVLIEKHSVPEFTVEFTTAN